MKRRSETRPEKKEGKDAPVDYYAQCWLLTIGEGQAIGVIEPAQPAVDGVDVFGNPIFIDDKPREVKLGAGVNMGPDGRTVYATWSGLVLFKDDTLAVDDVIKIDGDVDFNSGSLDVAADIIVKGTVRDLFNIKTTKSLSVGGTIESNEVEAGGNVVVLGGIVGKDKGSVSAGGQIVCKFCDGSTLKAHGDITIDKEAVRSDVHTMARLIVPHGAVIGGRCYAHGGAEAKEIGSEAEVPTHVTIGVDPVILAQASRADQEAARIMESAERIRIAVAPLMAEFKWLTRDQRGRATELMSQAGSIQKAAEEIIARKDEMIEQGRWHEEPVLMVQDRIYPGATLVFEDFEFIAREVLTGPVKIFERRASEGVASALICLHTLSGDERELVCRGDEVPQSEESLGQRSGEDGTTPLG